MARGLPVAGPVLRRGRASASGSRSRPTSSPSSTRTGWELYHVDEDFAENHDVAEEHRDRLIALIGTWYVEAGKYGVLPVDGSGLARMVAEKPLVALPRDRYVYLPGHPVDPVLRRPAGAQPAAQHHRRRRDPGRRRRGRPARARAQRPAATPCTSRTAGCTTCTTTSAAACTASPRRSRCPPGDARAAVRVRADRPARPGRRAGRARAAAALRRRDLVGRGRRARHHAVRAQPGALTCGANPGSPVTPDYPSPFRFTGTLRTVTVDVSGDLITDSESEMRMAMARQ